ncbi:hypothetical protein HanIR_Chr02g0083101 [Helianthus annuus]|nr:hypothetical protein HanIR_Chr02g0083101 [Helianthus annuus]
MKNTSIRSYLHLTLTIEHGSQGGAGCRPFGPPVDSPTHQHPPPSVSAPIEPPTTTVLVVAHNNGGSESTERERERKR